MPVEGAIFIGIDTAGVFFAASLLLALAPGPDNVFVMTNSSVAGCRAGLLVTLGLCTGLLVHTAVVVLGMAALLRSSAIALIVLQGLGAIYLVYLAWRSWFDTGLAGGPGSTGSVHGRPAAHWYVRGVVLNVTNPKVALFFLAFLPQFVHPGRAVWLQTLQLAALFVVATLIVFGGIAIAAAALGEHVRRQPRMRLVLNRVAALVFLALAARLLLVDL